MMHLSKIHPSKSRISSRADAVCAIILFVLTVTLYGRAVSFGFVNFDDGDYFFENSTVAQGLTFSSIAACFTQIVSGNWHPLTMLSHTLDAELFGIHPRGPHAVNVLIHALNASLLFVVLVKITARRWPASLCAAVFALHPLRVESVAWISERKDLLSGLLFLLTLTAYTRYIERPSAARYTHTAACLLLGLLSKPMLVTLPFLLVLIDFWPLNRVHSWSELRRSIVAKLPLFGIAFIFCCITIFAQQSGRSVASSELLPLIDRLGNAAVAATIYVHQLIWPQQLAPMYWHSSIPPGAGMPVSRILLASVTLLCVTSLAVIFRGRAPWLFVGWFWYLGMLVPVVGIVQVGWQAHADRYTYLPLIGVTLAISFGVDALRRRGKHWAICVHGIAGIAVVAISMLTYNQLGAWSSSLTLWKHALSVQPPNPLALNNYGAALTAEGRNDEAILAFQQAIELNPRFSNAMSNLARQHLARGDDQRAKRLLEQSLQIDARQPDAYTALGGIYLREGRPAGALLMYKQAVERWPDFADAHYNIAVTLAQQEMYQESLAYFRRVLELRPEDAEARSAMRTAEHLAQVLPTTGGDVPTTQAKP